MVKSPANYLKVFTERTPEVVRPELEGIHSLEEVVRAFREATGWSLRYESAPESSPPASLTWSTPANPGVGVTPGHLGLDVADLNPEVARPPVDTESARSLARAIGGVLDELLATQRELWKREAELAAGVPLVPARDEASHLAARLEAVLKGGTEAVGAHAAALYLLDEGTSELKMRSCWGLPRTRLTQPARPLKGALADLEALLGHAVVLENAKMMRYWSVPERFASAVCVPVATSTTILGTLWVFCRKKRDFNDQQTNMIEVVAGRLAADLEREMLLREGLDGAALKRQVAAAGRLQRGGLPSIAPLLDGWDAAGWAAQTHGIGGAFFDWFSLPDGLMVAALGDAPEQGVQAALTAAAVKTAVRSHAPYQRDPARLLKHVSFTLWTGSAGDQAANLFAAMIETASGRVHLGTAGQLGAIVVRAGSWESLSQPTEPAGAGPEPHYHPQHYDLAPGESLVVFSDGVADARDHAGRPLGEAGLGVPLSAQADLSAEALVALARDRLEAHAVTPDTSDRVVLVVKRLSA
ncbi:MAG: SpoIIE family protein phosphatase [Pirellulales bacterium]|nr:SpoIIE family protein phosphatase [Pirellulales bacterium]